MKTKLNTLSKQYVVALRNHVKKPPGATLQSALVLGRRAVGLGLETLELARMHEYALVALELSGPNKERTRLAALFFSEAHLPIEETHRTARQSQAHLHELEVSLSRRTEELAATHRELHRGAVHRKSMKSAFLKSGHRHHKSLEESLQLQNHLRQLTRRVLAAQEDERKHISHELQDEIAQTLLGINARLLNLKTGQKGRKASLTKEIASMQQLVVGSVRSINRFARKLDVPQPPSDACGERVVK